MKESNPANVWNRWLVVLIATACLIGAFWMWDANNYPMPGVPKAPPVPFTMPLWDWERTFPENLSEVQSQLQSKRYRRLQNKWIHGLDLTDTYWKSKMGNLAVHFGHDGSFTVRRPTGSNTDDLRNFTSYERSHVHEIIFEKANSGKVRVNISMLIDDAVMLVESTGGTLALLVREETSDHFDSLDPQ